MQSPPPLPRSNSLPHPPTASATPPSTPAITTPPPRPSRPPRSPSPHAPPDSDSVTFHLTQSTSHLRRHHASRSSHHAQSALSSARAANALAPTLSATWLSIYSAQHALSDPTLPATLRAARKACPHDPVFRLLPTTSSPRASDTSPPPRRPRPSPRPARPVRADDAPRSPSNVVVSTNRAPLPSAHPLRARRPALADVRVVHDDTASPVGTPPRAGVARRSNSLMARSRTEDLSLTFANRTKQMAGGRPFGTSSGHRSLTHVLRAADQMMGKGMLEQAIGKYTSVMEGTTTVSTSPNGRAGAAVKGGGEQQVNALYLRALASRSEAWLKHALRYDYSSSFACAIADAGVIIDVAPGIDDGWLRLGTAHLENGSPARAKHTFERGLSQCPTSLRLADGLRDSVFVIEKEGVETDWEASSSSESDPREDVLLTNCSPLAARSQRRVRSDLAGAPRPKDYQREKRSSRMPQADRPRHLKERDRFVSDSRAPNSSGPHSTSSISSSKFRFSRQVSRSAAVDRLGLSDVEKKPSVVTDNNTTGLVNANSSAASTSTASAVPTGRASHVRSLSSSSSSSLSPEKRASASRVKNAASRDNTVLLSKEKESVSPTRGAAGPSVKPNGEARLRKPPSKPPTYAAAAVAAVAAASSSSSSSPRNVPPAPTTKAKLAQQQHQKHQPQLQQQQQQEKQQEQQQKQQQRQQHQHQHPHQNMRGEASSVQDITGGQSQKLYELLQVPKDASGPRIKRSYYELARKCHPDKNTNDENATHEFQKLAEAYRVLSDPESRAVYDRYGDRGLVNNSIDMIDPSTLFAMVFGSEQFVHLIGELQLASLASNVDDEGNTPDERVLERYQRARVGKLTLEMVKFLKPWVEGDKKGFLGDCQNMMHKLRKASFGPKLLYTVGSVYVQQTTCILDRSRPHSFQALFRKASLQTHKIASRQKAVSAAGRVVDKQRKLHDRVMRSGRDNRFISEEEARKIAVEMAENAIDMMWKISVIDIESTLEDMLVIVLSGRDLIAEDDNLMGQDSGSQNSFAATDGGRSKYRRRLGSYLGNGGRDRTDNERGDGRLGRGGDGRYLRSGARLVHGQAALTRQQIISERAYGIQAMGNIFMTAVQHGHGM